MREPALNESSLRVLPNEVLAYVFSKLEISNLQSVAIVCKLFNFLMEDTYKYKLSSEISTLPKLFDGTNRQLYQHLQTIQNQIAASGVDAKLTVNKFIVGHTPLVFACIRGYEVLAKNLIAAGADVQAVGARGMTALHACAVSNLPDICENLLSKGLDVNALNAYNDTPLHLAAKYNSFHVAEILLQNGAAEVINHKGQYGFTPFTLVCRTGNFQLARLFYAYAKQDIDLTGNSNDRCLEFAAANGSAELVSLILKNHAKYVKDYLLASSIQSAMRAAIKSGSLTTVKVIFNNSNFEPNLEDDSHSSSSLSYLEYALDTRKFEIIKFVLDNILMNADLSKYYKPYSREKDIAIKAIESCDKSITDLIVSHGVDLNLIKEDAWQINIWKSNLKLRKFLRDYLNMEIKDLTDNIEEQLDSSYEYYAGTINPDYDRDEPYRGGDCVVC